MVGFIKGVRFDESNGGRLIGDFHVTNSAIKDILLNTWHADKSQMPGFSVDILGSGERVGNTTFVKEIKKAHSVDIVTRPSAGGQFERMVASYQNKLKDNKMDKFFEQILSWIKEGVVKLKESTENKTDEQILEQIKTEFGLKEAGLKENVVSIAKLKGILTPDQMKKVMALVEAETKESEDDPKEDPKPESEDKPKEEGTPKAEDKPKEESQAAKESFKEIEILKQEIKKDRAQAMLESILVKESTLNDKAKTRVRESFENKLFTSHNVYDAMNKEKEYLEHILESTVSDNKSGYVKVTKAPSDKLELALDLMVDPDLKTDDEFKESYRDVVPFRSLRDAIKRMDNLDVDDFLAADNKEMRRLKEATTADFTVALGDSMNKRMVRLYRKFAGREVWSKFVIEEDFTNLNEQKLFRFGGFQDLDTVAENGAYQETNTPSETNPVYTPFKKGNVFTLTEEMIINDNLRALRAFPDNMARAANRTLSKFVFGLVTGCDGSDNVNIQTIYNGNTLYNNDHGGNISPNVLNNTNFDTGVAVMMNQLEDTGSEDPIGIRTKYLLTSPNLRRVAWDASTNELTQANANGGSIQNALKEYDVEPLIVPEGYLCFSKTIWILIADPLDAEGIRIGYLSGKRTPEILLQDQPTVAGVFTNDQIKYRVKFRYGGTITDFRAFYGGGIS